MPQVLTRPAPTRPREPRLPLSPPRSPTRYAAPAPRPERTPRRRPAALRWRDSTLPLLGAVRATGWLPTILIASCALALTYLVQTSGIATTGYDIQRLQAEQSEWLLRNEQLRLELAKRQSLAWVESEAVMRLGMVQPETITYLPVGQ